MNDPLSGVSIMSRRWLAVPVVAMFVVWFTAADEPKKADKPVRTPWTTSKITGSPEPPPPFKSTRIFPNVKLNHPLLIARCPGSERLFVGEQDGVIYSIANKPDAKAEVFFNLKTELKTLEKTPNAKGISELYGLVFHPKFEENRYCYVFYTLASKGPRLADGSRLSRFTVSKTDPPRIDPASEEIVLAYLGGGHNGGDLHFSPTDGMLYISTGDSSGPNPPDPLNTGQDCSDLSSSILRIDVDKKDSGLNYAVPKDNPFVGMKDVRPEIWAYGFRNPWRMSFDRKTGQLWVGDVGWELWEMVHKIEKGGNYGWSIVEGRQPVKPDQKIGPTPIRPPMIELPHTISMSVTGGYVYRGKKFPELTGAYVFGDWETKRFWSARFDGDRLKEMPEIVKTGIRVSCFGEDNAGEIYYFDYDTGLMYTLEKNDAAGANTSFPKKLSETGLFKKSDIFNDLREQEPAAGVVPFQSNSAQWMDGAHAKWHIALPGTSSVTAFEKPRKLPGQVNWHDFNMKFPKDAVLVKTISEFVKSNMEGLQVGKAFETQILHYDGEDWHAYTYAWREDQSDADLVPADGMEKEYRFRKEPWVFASRTQCLTCHSAWSEYAMAFTVPQLNNAYITEEDGESNLEWFSKRGYINRLNEKDQPLPPYDHGSALKEKRLVWPFAGGPSLDERVRSYLHVNCAHCHRFGGGGGQVVFEMDFGKSLKDTLLFDAKPKQGDFGIADARLIAPGDPFKSVLLYRMAKFNHGRMPHLGSERPHTAALDQVANWIHGMKSKERLKLPKTTDEFENATRNVETALPFALAFGDRDNHAADHAKLLPVAAKLPPGPVRDLFDGYLPPDPKGRRIGTSPRPASILAKAGDPKNGEALFFNKELKCANCHKVGEKGVALGPDLSLIGKERTRAELLDSILFPSAKVDPKFASYLVKTHDGRSVAGLLVKRDEKQAVLRDVENKEIVLAADNVEAIQPSRLSLMPDGLVSGLTPQEAADLVEYLAGRK